MGLSTLFISFIMGLVFQTQTSDSKDLAEAVKLHTQTTQLYKEQKFEEALAHAKKVVVIREKLLPPNDVLLATSYTNLGYVFRSLGKYYDAERALKKALSIEESRAGKDHVAQTDLLISIGWLMHAQNNPMDAEPFFKRAVAISEKSYGAEHRVVAEQLYHLAKFYEKISKPGKAVPVFDRMIAIRVKVFGKVSNETKEAVEYNACALQQDKKVPEAEIYWKRSTNIEKALHPVIGEVETGVLTGSATKKVQPPYPEYAKSSRVQGSVIVHIVINESGIVEEARTLCGPDLLSPASEEAAGKWEFSPTKLNGKAVKVQGRLTFNFTLR